jgi:hypothetical protein
LLKLPLRLLEIADVDVEIGSIRAKAVDAHEGFEAWRFGKHIGRRRSDLVDLDDRVALGVEKFDQRAGLGGEKASFFS